MGEVNAQYAGCVDSTQHSPLKHCRMLNTNHATLPGELLRDQWYAMGWVRAEFPAQLGRISDNVRALGQEPIVDKGSPSHLVLYNHGCMPGSTSRVWLVPELNAGIVALQNSLGLNDTADSIGQLLLETLLEPPQPNDYVQIVRQFHEKAGPYIDEVKLSYDRPGSPVHMLVHCRSMKSGSGTSFTPFSLTSLFPILGLCA